MTTNNTLQEQTIRANARKEAGLINPETGLPLELDIYLPSLSLAFEYQVHSKHALLILLTLSFTVSQDPHHYKSAEYAFHTLEEYKKRDDTKRTLALSKGITLIIIPYWWDQSVNR